MGSSPNVPWSFSADFKNRNLKNGGAILFIEVWDSWMRKVLVKGRYQKEYGAYIYKQDNVENSRETHLGGAEG